MARDCRRSPSRTQRWGRRFRARIEPTACPGPRRTSDWLPRLRPGHRPDRASPQQSRPRRGVDAQQQRGRANQDREPHGNPLRQRACSRMRTRVNVVRRPSSPPRGDIGIDLLLQHVERQGPVLEHRGVEVADVEAVAQLLPRPLAQLDDLELADLVARRLAGIVDVALDLLDDVALATAANCPGNI